MKQTLILRKRNAPKAINLPNGKSFTSKWERISRKQLLINIKVQRQKKIWPRKNNRMIYLNLAAPGFRKIKRKRKEKILIDLDLFMIEWINQEKDLVWIQLKLDLILDQKHSALKLEKRIIDKGIDNIPNIFKFGVSKIKNKNVKKILSSDIADMVVDETQNRAKNKYKTLFD